MAGSGDDLSIHGGLIIVLAEKWDAFWKLGTPVRLVGIPSLPVPLVRQFPPPAGEVVDADQRSFTRRLCGGRRLSACRPAMKPNGDEDETDSPSNISHCQPFLPHLWM